jgi:hypothetical protein
LNPSITMIPVNFVNDHSRMRFSRVRPECGPFLPYSGRTPCKFGMDADGRRP